MFKIAICEIELVQSGVKTIKSFLCTHRNLQAYQKFFYTYVQPDDALLLIQNHASTGLHHRTDASPKQDKNIRLIQ